MSNLLDEVMKAQKRGERRGIPSICSAHPAVLDCALHEFHPVLIEATCNQVNQFGGYTGMTPAEFQRFVHQKAVDAGFPADELILGGDHLGPSPWQALPEQEAMANAVDLVKSYAKAGFTKLHIDCSMRLGGDDAGKPLELEVSAKRTAMLIRAAERTVKDPSILRYVIGSEVPIPGGAHEHESGVQVTLPSSARETLESTQFALQKIGCGKAWQKVIALVVQPGVEFGSDFILDYEPKKAVDLVKFSETTPLIYEAHSTDYQDGPVLKNLVRDHFAILKVGPALTFAYREVMFALAIMEDELVPIEDRSRLIAVLESAMLRNPKHWQGHYPGTPDEQAFQRKFSLSDRSRYYWTDPEVLQAVTKLKANWKGRNIPLSLASQYLPDFFDEIRSEKMRAGIDEFVQRKICNVLDGYYQASGLVE